MEPTLLSHLEFFSTDSNTCKNITLSLLHFLTIFLFTSRTFIETQRKWTLQFNSSETKPAFTSLR